MNFVAILIWLTLAGFIVKGFMKGLVRQVCSLLGLLIGGWAALKYYPFVAEASRHLIHLPPRVATSLSFLFIFLVVGLLFFFLGHLLTVIFKIMLLGGVNRVGGVVLGAEHQRVGRSGARSAVREGAAGAQAGAQVEAE